MKKVILSLFLLFGILTVGTMTLSAAENPKVLRHVVMFKFKESAKPSDIQMVEKAFATLPQKIKEIKGYEWGTNCSPEGLNQGLTHCFVLTFSSDKDRDAYLVHPAHKDFGKTLGPVLDKVTVLDFWAK